MKTINFAGVTFELHDSKMHPVAPITGYNYHEIYEVYDRPSDAKVSIWHDWCKWVNAMRDAGYECGIQIESHNCMFFTITGSVRTGEHTYNLWITAAHNRCYKYC